MNRKFNLCFASLVLWAEILGAGAIAQDYPQKPIRWIVPLTPGGGSDFSARLIGGKLSQALGQPIVVENRPGASGRIGAEMVARAAPDGYTILQTTGSLVIDPSMYANLRYDVVKDFEPITKITDIETMLFVHPSVPAKSVRELVRLAKSKPGRLNYGSSGIGLIPHLAMERFKLVAGIDVTHVPFKGGSEAIIALRGGHVEMALAGTTSSLHHVKAGTLRALAITSVKRSAYAPDVPTMEESGYPGFESGSWGGVWAPAGTSKQIIAKLHTEIVKILKTPDVVEQLQKAGMEPSFFTTPDEFAKNIKAQIVTWGEVVKAARIQRQ
jgi:tripartite-type tricarboxylate transporter receptor subunit TctC